MLIEFFSGGWRRAHTWLVMFGLLVVVFLMNANALHNEFLNWDDPLLVTENVRVQADHFAGLMRVFSPADALAGRHLEYLPLRDFGYALIFYFKGLEPFSYHVVQIAFHAVTCMLVFWCASIWVGRRAALAAAFLFAAHPIHVEAVIWISCLKEPTFTTCVLLSLGWHFQRRNAEGRRRIALYAGSLVMMIAALAFKQIAIVIPALLVVVEYAFGPRDRKIPIVDKIPYAVIAAAAFVFYFIIGSRNHVIIDPPGGTRFTGFLTMTVVYVEYLQKLVAPFDLSARYVVKPVMTMSDLRFLVSMGIIVSLWTMAIRWRDRTRIPLFVLGWFTVSVLPVMNIVPIPIEMADRYLYLPSVGFVIGMGAGLDALMKKSKPLAARLVALGTVSLIVLWGSLSIAGNEVWTNDVTLWSSVIARYPEFYIGRTSLGAAYLKRGDVVSAERELRQSIATFSGDATAYLNLGMLFRGQKRFAEAKEAFQKVVAIKPDYPKAYNNLAMIAMDQKEWTEATAALDRALTLSPEYATAHRNYAVVCMQLADPTCAIDHMRKAIEARPADRVLFLEWMNLLAVTHSERLALDYRERLDRRYASDAEVWGHYAELLARAGLSEAGEAIERANRLGADAEKK